MSEPGDATYPYDARAPRAVASSVRHQWDVTLDYGGINAPAEVASATVRFDEGWAPHVQAQLTCAIPDAATLAALDPRTTPRLVIAAGYIYPETSAGPAFAAPDVWTMCTLGITRRAVRRPQGDLVLSAMSDEVLCQEGVWRSSEVTTIPPNTAAHAIGALLQAATGRGLAVDHDDPVLEVGARPDGSPWADEDWRPAESIGTQTYWSLMQSIADSWDLWLYDRGLDHDGAPNPGEGWVLGFRPTVATTSRALLRTGPVGSLTDTESVVSREDGWANTLHLIHRWTDATGDRIVRAVSRSITSGPMSVSEIGRHTLVVERDAPISATEIGRAASSLVRRTVTRGRSYTLTAPALYWLRPGHTVTVQLPTGGQERHLVASVEFTYPEGVMRLTTRLPESVTIGGSD